MGCKAKGKLEVEVESNGDANVIDNQGTSFADGNGNQGTCFSDDNVNDNGNDNQGTCFANDKQESSLSEEDDIVWSKARDYPTKQRDKLCSQCGCGGAPSPKASRRGAPVNSKGNLLINVNGSLQSWITDSNITIYAPFPENLRCIITGTSECGKTV